MSFPQEKGELVALTSINIAIPRGSLTTIVGPSGCGKSTLLKIVAGLIEPTQGLVQIHRERLMRGIAYVPQSAALLPWRTARQNACIGLEVQLAAAKKGETLEKEHLELVDSMFEKWHLADFGDSYPSELSGGMAQRVALIRALISRPTILLCDEPFSAIDFVTRLRLSTEFKNMCSVKGITTILVTHNIEEAIFLGDQVLVMSGRPGRIVNTHRPAFSVGGNNAVECRTSPEFGILFNAIWQDLEKNHT